MKYIYKDKFGYELNNKIFQGSKKRAKLALEQCTIEPICIESFIEYIEVNFNNIVDLIDYIEFREFIYYERNKLFSYHLAFIYTLPDKLIRDGLFDERDKITYDTGWYPYITGMRADINNLEYMKLKKYRPRPLKKISMGKPISLLDIAIRNDVSAILLKCEHGGILFDTGFGIDMQY